MEKAIIFGTGQIVTAKEVLEGEYGANPSAIGFVDENHRYRVVFVTDSKGHSGPYFRRYYSRKDYAKINPNKRTREDIVLGRRHHRDTQWHKDWESRFDFAQKEKWIINPITEDKRRADVYCEESNLVIEIQHSYTDREFKEKNEFYSDLKKKVIWIFDLSAQDVIYDVEEQMYSVLEFNGKGFFRIAEEPNNLSDNIVFLNTHQNMMYQISRIQRKDLSDTGDTYESTIMYFTPDNIFTIDEFVDRIKKNDLSFMNKSEYTVSLPQTYDYSLCFPHDEECATENSCDNSISDSTNELSTVYELWRKDYQFMVLENSEENNYIVIWRDRFGNMETREGVIVYQYVTVHPPKIGFDLNSPKKYFLSREKCTKRIWKIYWAKNPD